MANDVAIQREVDNNGRCVIDPTKPQKLTRAASSAVDDASLPWRRLFSQRNSQRRGVFLASAGVDSVFYNSSSADAFTRATGPSAFPLSRAVSVDG